MSRLIHPCVSECFVQLEDLGKLIADQNQHQIENCVNSSDMGRIILESNALNYYHLPKMCIEYALLDFEKVMH